MIVVFDFPAGKRVALGSESNRKQELNAQESESPTLGDELLDRLEKLDSDYVIYVFACLFVGGIGVWTPLLWDMSTPEYPHLPLFITYGFAMSGGMLLDVFLRRDVDGRLYIAGSLLVMVALAMLLSPFWRFGVYPWLSYLGTALIVGVWALVNIDEYERKAKWGPENARGAATDAKISGKGLPLDD